MRDMGFSITPDFNAWMDDPLRALNRKEVSGTFKYPFGLDRTRDVPRKAEQAPDDATIHQSICHRLDLCQPVFPGNWGKHQTVTIAL
jgi:hypothetical protein